MENRHSVSMHFMQAVQCSGMGWDDCASGEMVFKNWCGFLVAQDTCGAIPWYIYFYKSGFQSSLYRMVSFRSQWKGLEFGCAGAQIMISQEFVSSTCTALGLCHKGWQDGTRGGVAVEICTWKLLSWEMHHWAQSCCSVEAVSAQAEQCQWLCLGCACSHTHPGPGVPRELSSFLRWAAEPSRDGDQLNLQKSLLFTVCGSFLLGFSSTRRAGRMTPRAGSDLRPCKKFWRQTVFIAEYKARS